MIISEIFESFQGEGPWAGTPSLFIRTSGCNLRCWFCDTPYTSWEPEGSPHSSAELAAAITDSSAEHVVLTGGEPMLSPEIAQLTALCRQHNRVITIETAGTVDQPVDCDLMAISPKLSNSSPDDRVWGPRHDQRRHQPEVIRQFLARYNCILKFVVDREADLTEIEEYLREFPEADADQIWLMPQARTAEEVRQQSEWLQPQAELRGFRFSSRSHILKYGNQRGV